MLTMLSFLSKSQHNTTQHNQMDYNVIKRKLNFQTSLLGKMLQNRAGYYNSNIRQKIKLIRFYRSLLNSK